LPARSIHPGYGILAPYHRSHDSRTTEAITPHRATLSTVQTTLDQIGDRSAPASFHHYGAAQLTAATGRVLLQLGNHSDARELLTAAVVLLASIEAMVCTPLY
jgi:hypothetical protein